MIYFWWTFGSFQGSVVINGAAFTVDAGARVFTSLGRLEVKQSDRPKCPFAYAPLCFPARSLAFHTSARNVRVFQSLRPPAGIWGYRSPVSASLVDARWYHLVGFICISQEIYNKEPLSKWLVGHLSIFFVKYLLRLLSIIFFFFIMGYMICLYILDISSLSDICTVNIIS